MNPNDEMQTPETVDSVTEPDASGPDAPEPRHKTARKTKNRDEFESRVHMTAQLLSQFIPKGQIKSVLKARFQVSARMAERYIHLGKKLLEKWASKSPEEARIDMCKLLRGLLTGSGTIDEKLRIVDRYTRLLGLNMPDKVAPCTPEGAAVQFYRPFEAEVSRMSTPELEAIVAFSKWLEAHPEKAVSPAGADKPSANGPGQPFAGLREIVVRTREEIRAVENMPDLTDEQLSTLTRIAGRQALGSETPSARTVVMLPEKHQSVSPPVEANAQQPAKSAQPPTKSVKSPADDNLKALLREYTDQDGDVGFSLT